MKIISSSKKVVASGSCELISTEIDADAIDDTPSPSLRAEHRKWNLELGVFTKLPLEILYFLYRLIVPWRAWLPTSAGENTRFIVDRHIRILGELTVPDKRGACSNGACSVDSCSANATFALGNTVCISLVQESLVYLRLGLGIGLTRGFQTHERLCIQPGIWRRRDSYWHTM